MKKFFTVAVVVLLASFSFGATENFYSLSEKEMENEFVKMTKDSTDLEVIASKWAEVINNAFETQTDKVIATVLRATAKALNRVDKLEDIDFLYFHSELSYRCPDIIIRMNLSTREHVISLVLWDSYTKEGFFLPIEYKTSKFTGKMPTISREVFK